MYSGRRVQRGSGAGTPTSATQGSSSNANSNNSNGRTATTTKWLSKETAAAANATAVKGTPRLVFKKAADVQQKLILPGENGSGLSFPRASGSSSSMGSASKKARTSGSSSSGTAKGSTVKGSKTLDSFWEGKSVSIAKNQGKKKPSSATTPAVCDTPRSDSSTSARRSSVEKGKQRAVVYTVLDDTQPEAGPSSPMRIAQAADEQQLEQAITSEPEPNLRSDKSDLDYVLPNTQDLSHFYAHDAVDMNMQGPFAPPKQDLEMDLRLPEIPLDHIEYPPMPVPLRNTLFGFGRNDSPSLGTQQSSKKRKRQRLIVTTSSPVKEPRVLAGRSSPATSLSHALSEEESEDEAVKATHCPNKHQSASPLPPPLIAPPIAASPGMLVQNPPPRRLQRAGTRLAWDSDDEHETRRLNRTASELEAQEVQDSLVAKAQKPPRRAAREALIAPLEKTDYMDRYRSESYSPVEYTATEGKMNAFRAFMGLSPRERTLMALSPEGDLELEQEGEQEREREQEASSANNTEMEQGYILSADNEQSADAGRAAVLHETPTSVGAPLAMDLDNEDDDATQHSVPPSQADPGAADFIDESATERSTGPTSQLNMSDLILSPTREKADDSGYAGSSSPSGLAKSQQVFAQGPDLAEEEHRSRDVLEDEDVIPESYVAPRRATARQRKRDKREEHVDKRLSAIEEAEPSTELELELCLDGSEEYSLVSQVVTPVKREKRILAFPSPDDDDLNTQNVCFNETLGESFVPCSQDDMQELLSEDQDASPAQGPGVCLPQPPLDSPTKPTRIVKQPKSVTGQISAAFDGKTLADVTAAAASKANAAEGPTQTCLREYFPAKPNGPAERAASLQAEQERSLMRAVVGERKSRKPSISTLSPRRRWEDEDIEFDEVSDQLAPAQRAEAILEDTTCVSDSDSEEMARQMSVSLSQVGPRVSCEGWVTGKRQSQTPTPVKRYRRWRLSCISEGVDQ